jgi:hypothetical protein
MESGLPKFSPYINGAMAEPSSGKFFQRFDPGDKGNLIGLVGDGSRDVGAAVDAAGKPLTEIGLAGSRTTG